MIEVLVLLSLFGIAAPFVLYPIGLWLRAVTAASPSAREDYTPPVDLIICAHDEANSISAKIENALELDYPTRHLQIWVASDGSTDGTVELARQYEDRGVRVLDLPRSGKAIALTTAVETSSAPIIAFSDANSMWTPGALRALTAPFIEDRVGGVAGDQRYAEKEGDHDAIGERSYWSFDRQLKRWQSHSGCIVSATGAIYAIRRSLFRSPPVDATDDFMISTEVVAQGQQLRFAPEAIAVEPVAPKMTDEFRRKVRIATRGLRGLAYRRGLLWPAENPGYALELLLHKLWRRLTWIPLLALLLLAPFCWIAGGWPSIIGLGVVGAVAAGALAWAFPQLARLRPFGIAAYVVMVNTACAVATINTIRGHRVSHWSPDRGQSELEGSA